MLKPDHRIDLISISLDAQRRLELVDIHDFTDDEIRRAGAGLSQVVIDRPELLANYPNIAKKYGNPTDAHGRLVTVSKIKDDGFFARLIVVSEDGNLSETLGMATAYNATPGISMYEGSGVSDERLKTLYGKMQTNVTFWCGKEIMVGTDGGDGLRTIPLPPKPLDQIAARLVDVWGRRIEHTKGGVYTLLPETRSETDPVDPTESLRLNGWIGTGITGVSACAGVSTSMEVIIPQ